VPNFPILAAPPSFREVAVANSTAESTSAVSRSNS
jgi:hypothetical protein